MILGLTGICDTSINGICDLPSAYDLSVPSTLNALVQDPLLERVYAIVATPYDPVAGSIATWPLGGASGVWLCSDEYHSQPGDTPANQHFSCRLRSPYNVQFSLFSSGALASRSLPAYGAIEILGPGGEIDYLTSLSWAGCSIQVYLGQKGAAWSTFTQIFSGTAAGATWTTESILIQLRGLDYLFSKPMQPNLYTAPAVKNTVAGDSVTWSTFPGQTGSITIEGWWYVSDIATATQRLLAHDSGSHGWFVQVAGTGEVVWATRDLSSASLASAASSLVVGWNHIAVAYDHSGQTKTIYVMGVNEGSATGLTGALVAPGVSMTAFKPSLGAPGSSTTAGSRFAELRIWNTARTQAQIQQNMRLRMLGTEAGLVGYWPGWTSSDGSGSTIHDQSSGANNGTLTGTAAWDTADWVDPSIAGKSIPLSYGIVRFRDAILVDANTPNGATYQVHDRGIQSVDTVYDKGSPLTLTTQYTVDLTRGYITLQQAPAGQITVDLHGDNVGGFVSTAADVTRRIAVRHGGLSDPAQINTGAFSLTNTANSAPIGYATTTDPVNIDTSLDQIMSSLGGWWTFTRQGLLTLGILTAPGQPSLTLTEKDIVIDAKPLQRSATPDPAWRESLGYHRIWKTLQPSDLTFGLSASKIALYGQDYSNVTAVGSLQGPTAAFPLAQDRVDTTLLDVASDAQAESNRRFALYYNGNNKRDLFQLVLSPRSLFQYFLGDVVQVQLNLLNQSGPLWRLGLNGANFVVVGVIENVLPTVDTPDDIEIILWGSANTALRQGKFLVNDDLSRRGTDDGNLRILD